MMDIDIIAGILTPIIVCTWAFIEYKRSKR